MHEKRFGRITEGLTEARIDRSETKETDMSATEMLETGLNDKEKLNEGFKKEDTDVIGFE